MEYRPSPSVATVRVFSISAGLAASTGTPGSASPELSRTVPAMPLACWADAVDARKNPQTRTRNARTTCLQFPYLRYGVLLIDSPSEVSILRHSDTHVDTTSRQRRVRSYAG